MKYIAIFLLLASSFSFAGDETLIIVDCIPEIGITHITPVEVEFNYYGIPSSIKDKYSFLKKKYGIHQYPKKGEKIHCKTMAYEAEIEGIDGGLLSLKVNGKIVMKDFTLGLALLGSVGLKKVPSISKITIEREFYILVCGNASFQHRDSTAVCKYSEMEKALKSGINESQFNY